uniref:Uncharacterized protein n=1 Tax=Tanacetum cinerariifolium TaxID=118510 RepID=A0A6L2P3K9_TANCI|nr:hypothetical protein [Tanacetum cinerariifolium]
MPKVLLLAWDRVFEIKDALGNKQYNLEDIQELFRKLLNDVQNIHEELVEYINTPGWNRPALYDDDDDDDVDYTIAITPVLSTEEPDNSLSMRDEHLDTIPATKSDKVIKSSVEDLVPIPSESEGIPDTMCDVHLVNNPTPLEAKDHFEIVINSNDDYSSSDDDSLYNENIEYVEASPHDSALVSLEVNLLIAKIEALKDNPTPSSEFLTKSASTSPKSILEETNTFDNSLPEFENFCFDLEEISSGSTTTHSNISLPDYEAFSLYDDHIEEISSGSTTTHSDISLFEYDSFIFDLSNDQCPPTDRSDFTHEEFTDELAHIISPLEYDCFYFMDLPDPGEWISSLNAETCENLSSTTCVNLPVEDDHSPLLAYVVKEKQENDKIESKPDKKQEAQGALSLYVGNGQREAVEAIGVIYLCLPSGLVIVLNNCHYAPFITRGVISVFHLYEDGFINRFMNNTIQVSRNNMVYFSVIPRDGIFEIDLSNSYTNESSIYTVSKKRAKLDLDSALLWHCRLRHISKKRIEKLQHDGLLNSTDLRVFEKCVSCMFGKMAKKPYTHQDHGIIAHRTPPYTSQHNGVSERRNRTLLDMVRSMMSRTTLSKSFWDYALGTAARILNMGCETLVKRDTLTKTNKLEPRSSKCIFIGYPKETMGYSFYYPPENKVLVARNAEFLEKSLINQKASGSLEDLKIIQEEDTHPSIDTSLNHEEVDLEIDEPQSDIVPIRRSTRTRHAPNRMFLYIDVEEHELGDIGEPANYTAALLDLESEKWLNDMNVEMQSMKDNEVWVLVELPPNGKTVDSKWLFKKKTDMDGVVHTIKLVLWQRAILKPQGLIMRKPFLQLQT